MLKVVSNFAHPSLHIHIKINCIFKSEQTTLQSVFTVYKINIYEDEF